MCSMFRGSDTETQPCGTPVCAYPRLPCCSGFVKMLSSTSRAFECISVFTIHKIAKKTTNGPLSFSK